MFVKQLLAGKPSGNVLTIKASETVSRATEILSEMRIGALIVSNDGHTVDGILSERDIIREIGKRGTPCMNDTVGDVMTTAVIGCHLDDTTEKAMEKMSGGRFRHMPVIEDGKLVGVISIGDIVAARIKEIESENAAMADMIAGNL
ncbi:MAG TPA: CBS domain-containing protein [Paracoccaceae bacterium]|nr:CBS domain-containing protein [Paracoccaceae bacterium]